MPVSQENETVLKGKVAPKKQNGTEEDMEDDNMPKRHIRHDEVAMGLGGDVEKQFKMLGFADQSSVPRHHFVAGVDVVLPLRGKKNERAFAALVS